MTLMRFVKISMDEYKFNICFSIFLFVIIDFVYCNYTGLSINNNNGILIWQGGNDIYNQSVITISLKLLNVSAIFLTVGNVAQKLSSNIMLYILSRSIYYKKVITTYTLTIILLGILLLLFSHVVFYFYIDISLGQVEEIILYFFLDSLGFSGVIVLYLILNNVFLLDNSIIYILIIYMLNTVLPVPVYNAMSTANFLVHKSQIGVCPILLMIVLTDVIIGVAYIKMSMKRRICLC